MALSNELISQFAKLTTTQDKTSPESTVYGTIVEYNGEKYVQIDGSELLTPVSSTTNVEAGDRATVQIKNHTATVTGSTTSPSATVTNINVLNEGIKVAYAEIDELIAENVTIKDSLTVVNADITKLEADNVTIKDRLTANEASIVDLETENATITGKLEAVDADIQTLQTDQLTVAGKIAAAEADIGEIQADFVAVDGAITAAKADIETLKTEKLSATDAELKYANIDFTNIGKAAIENFYATSGIIKDLVIGDTTITGELVGVTIKGDLIEGGTVVADKLVVKGEDGLYYKLNTDGVSVESEQTEYNSLNGSVITAKSITATKIAVDDLVAFDATIGGFNITENSLYSGAKASVDNTTRGIYLDNTGQIAFGDGSNYLKYYYDETDQRWKLVITAQSIVFGASGTSVEDEIEALKDEITTFLYIGSSNGTVFKNDGISTVLSVTIYRGSKQVTDMETLKSLMGDTAKLRWSFQRFGEETYYEVDPGDSRIGSDGFTFTLTSEDVDAKATFVCELVV